MYKEKPHILDGAVNTYPHSTALSTVTADLLFYAHMWHVFCILL